MKLSWWTILISKSVERGWVLFISIIRTRKMCDVSKWLCFSFTTFMHEIFSLLFLFFCFSSNQNLCEKIWTQRVVVRSCHLHFKWNVRWRLEAMTWLRNKSIVWPSKDNSEHLSFVLFNKFYDCGFCIILETQRSHQQAELYSCIFILIIISYP